MQKVKANPHRIIVIDDNPSVHQDYRKILSPNQRTIASDAETGFFGEECQNVVQVSIDIQLDFAFQGQEALGKVESALREERPYSLAFVDMRMPPGWDGLRTVQELWRVQPDLQIVFCTAYSDNSWDDIYEQLGQTDQMLILKKPFDNVEVAQLAIAMTKKWSLTRDSRLRERDLERMVEMRTAELQSAALHDSLTGLANRTNFNDRLQLALARARRSADEKSAILLVDLDYFKGVNDSLGHPAGDELIRAVADRLQNCVRETDCVARLGGDEFAILQAAPTDAVASASQVERLFDVMKEPFEIAGSRFQIGISCGIAISKPDSTPSDLMKNADLALYRAKADGRNCYRLFEEAMDRRIKQHRRVAMELKHAIEANQFQLYYQPIFKSATGEIESFEALLRWNHPERGVLAPGEFLAVAEGTGLTGPIGEWAIAQACNDALQFPNDAGVSVNVSAVQFRQNKLLASIRESLSRTGLCPSRLKVEIVESVVLNKSQTVVRVLDQLHQLGVRIAMDDFGTGYSSLGYLRTFPFDIIKLDRSFVWDTPECEESMGIIRAVATLGECLNLELVAEGVETREQLECVVAAGYHYTQGYYHARPMPLDKVLEAYRTPCEQESANS